MFVATPLWWKSYTIPFLFLYFCCYLSLSFLLPFLFCSFLSYFLHFPSLFSTFPFLFSDACSFPFLSISFPFPLLLFASSFACQRARSAKEVALTCVPRKPPVRPRKWHERICKRPLWAQPVRKTFSPPAGWGSLDFDIGAPPLFSLPLLIAPPPSCPLSFLLCQLWMQWAPDAVRRAWIQKHPGGSKTVLMRIEFYKKGVFYHSDATICVPWKVANLVVQICVSFFFRGNGVFATVKHNFLLYFDLTNSGIFFSLNLSQHLGSLLKQLLVFIDEAPLPHFGI